MSSLDELRKRLYKKEEQFSGRRQIGRRWFLSGKKTVPAQWQKDTTMAAASVRTRRLPFYIWIVIVVAVVVLALVSAAALYLSGYFDAGAISNRNIALEITAPREIGGGEEVEWQVVITNNNDVPLRTADVIVAYPDGTRSLAAEALTRERRQLGVLNSGEERREAFRAFVFGPEDAEKLFRVSLEYRPEGSSAIFAKEAEALLRIASAPVGVTVLLPDEIKAGQEITLTVEYVSHAAVPLGNVVLELTYPFGFAYRSSNPQPTAGENRWQLGTLQPGLARSLQISGVLSGEEFEEKAFRATVGSPVAGEDEELFVYGSGIGATQLKKPFLDVAVRAGANTDAVVFAGREVTVDIPWQNNLPVAARNVVIEATAEGDAVDRVSISPENGAMRGATIVWNAGTFPSLRQLDPGEQGRVRLHFRIRGDIPRTDKTENFTVKISARIFPAETPVGFDGTDVSGTGSATLRVGSQLQLARTGRFYGTAIANAGPLPPEVGKETSFTLTWSLTNAYNRLEGVSVRTVLPPYMRWRSVVVPAGEDMRFDAASGELVWNVGVLAAGVGFTRPARAVDFHIGFVPTANHIGSSHVLSEKTIARGTDTFVNVVLEDETPELRLSTLDDPQLTQTQLVVSPARAE